MRSRIWSGLAALSLTAGVAQAADDEPVQPQIQTPAARVTENGSVVIEGSAAAPQPSAGTISAGVIMVRRKLSEYWLGIDCTPLSPAMRAQLKLADDEGMLVEKVMEGSPAAKGGLQPHDILLSAGKTSLKDVGQLVELLDKNKDQELSLSVIRGGEKMTVAVTPEKRPEPTGPVRDRVRWIQGEPARAWEQMREQLEQAGAPVRMHFFHPGALLPSGAAVATAATKFPDDLNVQIKKHGNEPAEIVVEQGKEKWKTTEDKLDALPESVRPHVASLLGRPMPFNIQLNATAPIAGQFTTPVPPPGIMPEPIEARFREMNRRLEQIREDLNELRGKPRKEMKKPAAEKSESAPKGESEI